MRKARVGVSEIEGGGGGGMGAVVILSARAQPTAEMEKEGEGWPLAQIHPDNSTTAALGGMLPQALGKSRAGIQGILESKPYVIQRLCCFLLFAPGI